MFWLKLNVMTSLIALQLHMIAFANLNNIDYYCLNIFREQYIEHVITHSMFTKNLYVENDNLNEYIDDEEFEDSSNELVNGKKRNKVSKPKPCSKCDFMAKTKLALWLHLHQHFIQEECSSFVCNSCPFATTLKHRMTFHWFSAHDDFKAYMCSECSYA